MTKSTWEQRIDATLSRHFKCLAVMGVLTSGCFIFTLFMWNSWALPAEAESPVLAVSLTIIEIMLAALAILLGVGAFFGFWLFREAAVGAAREEARQEVSRLAPQLFEQTLRTRDVGYQDQGQQASDAGISKDTQEEIIASAEEITGDDDGRP